MLPPTALPFQRYVSRIVSILNIVHILEQKGDYFPGVPGSYVLRNELLVPYDRERVAANTLSNPARFLYYIYLPQQSFIVCFLLVDENREQQWMITID